MTRDNLHLNEFGHWLENNAVNPNRFTLGVVTESYESQRPTNRADVTPSTTTIRLICLFVAGHNTPKFLAGEPGADYTLNGIATQQRRFIGHGYSHVT